MALKDTQANSDPVGRCKFGRVFDGLSKDDQATLTEWVDRGFGVPRIKKGLDEEHITIGPATIDSHLVGSCCCHDEGSLKGARRGAQTS